MVYLDEPALTLARLIAAATESAIVTVNQRK